MEERKILKTEKTSGQAQKYAKRVLLIETARALAFFVFGLLLGTKRMIFDTSPLAFALLAASTRQAPFVLVGVMVSSFYGGELSLPMLFGTCVTVALRILARLFLDRTDGAESEGRDPLYFVARLFSEHTYLRMMSGAVGVFTVGIWRIIAGGFRFYDLFAAIFYLVLTPVATFLYSKYFNVCEKRLSQGRALSLTPSEERLYDLSVCLLLCSLVHSLEGASLAGISISIFIAALVTLFTCKKGVLYGIVAGLLLGLSIAPSYAPMLAFCAIAYASVCKLSLFGGAIAASIAGLVFAIYVGGFSSLATVFPALLSSSMVASTAERINALEDLERFLKPSEATSEPISIGTVEGVIAEKKASVQDERLRSISDSFCALSEIFYNLSSRLKRPTMLDLRAICEQSFEKHCESCENHEICFGAEYGATLDVMKKMTVQLHSTGLADAKKLPESFKVRCRDAGVIADEVNRSCAIATKKAFQNEKTEIFALDYDAISKILNDAIAENEEEFKIDHKMSKKLARVIADEGYGEHAVSAFGRRKLRIIARGLDLSDKAADVSTLKASLESATRVSLSDPTFELAFGSVNMQIEARRAFSADAAFATVTKGGESVCGDTVSIFENKNDYLYALISDGMGTGKAAALTSEMCNVFLRNMLSAGNRMETSLRMLNSVLRAKGSKSEAECSATVDLFQLDMYSGGLTLVKSGAAPTFVLRRDNVFKLASPSLPIGILRALDAKQIDLSCEDGDVVVMVSDGATRGGDECAYLSELLREPSLADESAKRIADKIIRRARAENDYQNDDISVVVVKIKKELCNW